MKKYLLIILILLIAGFLRFWHLGSNPPSLTWDETAWGYNAYSLGIDGKDEFGRFLPLDYLESFGDFKPPVYAYLDVLPIKIFGLNEFAVRFPSALLGTLTILVTYFLTKQLFSDEKEISLLGLTISLPIVTAFILAISPWHIMLSRAAFEANVASFFIISGVTSFLLAVRGKHWSLFLSAICFSLSIATFNTARIVAPIILLILFLKFFPELWKQKKWIFISVFVGFVLSGPTLLFMLKPQSRLRFQEVNIFSDPTVVEHSVQEVSNDDNMWWSKIIHNRRWGYTQSFLKHYFDNLNPTFLFIKGDGNPKFSTQSVGEMYFWEVPFLIIGLIFLIKRKKGVWWLIPIWLLIGIIPAATARETPHALRIETTLPTWQILVAFGFWIFLEKINLFRSILFKSGILVILGCILIFEFVYFQHDYWVHYIPEYSSEWQFGYKDTIEYINSVQNNYDQIYYTDSMGRPYIYFLFYLQMDPSQFRNTTIINRDPFGFVNIKSVGKYYFGISENSNPAKSLYIDDSNHVPPSAHVVKEFSLPDGTKNLKAYEI